MCFFSFSQRKVDDFESFAKVTDEQVEEICRGDESLADYAAVTALLARLDERRGACIAQLRDVIHQPHAITSTGALT